MIAGTGGIQITSAGGAQTAETSSVGTQRWDAF